MRLRVIAALAVAALAGCKKAAAPVVYQALPVEHRDIVVSAQASGTVQRLEQAHDLLAGGAVQVARRLVGQENAGRVDQRTRDGDALPLSAGELVGPVLDPVA